MKDQGNFETVKTLMTFQSAIWCEKILFLLIYVPLFCPIVPWYLHFRIKLIYLFSYIWNTFREIPNFSHIDWFSQWRFRRIKHSSFGCGQRVSWFVAPYIERTYIVILNCKFFVCKFFATRIFTVIKISRTGPAGEREGWGPAGSARNSRRNYTLNSRCYLRANGHSSTTLGETDQGRSRYTALLGNPPPISA